MTVRPTDACKSVLMVLEIMMAPVGIAGAFFAYLRVAQFSSRPAQLAIRGAR